MSTLELFGLPQDEFSVTEAKTKFDAEGTEAVKTYILGYFAKTNEGFVKWSPSVTRIVQITRTMLAHHVPNLPGPKQWSRPNEKLNPSELVDAFPICSLQCDPTKGRTWESKGMAFINVFGGWKWPDKIKKSEITPEGIAGMKLWLQHIKLVWADNDVKVFNFILRWFARIAQKQKNYIALNLKSIAQGAGKSCVFDFMRKFVFGDSATLLTDKTETFTGQFNAELAGKMMVVLEEIDSNTRAEYKRVSGKLKYTISDNSIEIREKYRTPYKTDNCLSIAVCANRDAIMIEHYDRRWALLDINESKVGDRKYFKALADAMNEDVGKAMWAFLRSLDLTKADDHSPPETKAREEKKIDTLDDLYRFLKTMYLSRKWGIVGVPLSKLHDEFKKGRENRPKYAPQTVAKLLRAIGAAVVRKKLNGKAQFVVDITYEKLYAVFKTNKWISEYDALPEPADEVAPALGDVAEFV